MKKPNPENKKRKTTTKGDERKARGEKRSERRRMRERGKVTRSDKTKKEK
ncbi:MAG: hypothetical protein IJ479_04135 [Alphaproteobacteria bacterium]|nr:hypothetical protein [Alphaproteobacteria bacterium]